MSTRQQIVITAQTRDLAGKVVRRLRKQNFIPAVLYGHEVKNTNLSVPRSDFEKAYRAAGESTIVQLKVGESTQPVSVIIHDIQRHGTSDEIDHIDFYQVNLTEKLTADIPLKFVGEAPAVKEQGGTLVHQLSEIEVESLPTDLPHEIEVNISGLKTFEDVIRVKDLGVDRTKVEILADEDQIIAAVQPPRSEEELAELDTAPVAEDVSQVEGVAEKDKAEGEEAGTGEEAEAKEETKAEDKE